VTAPAENRRRAAARQGMAHPNVIPRPRVAVGWAGRGRLVDSHERACESAAVLGA